MPTVPEHLRVLVVEDSPADLALVRAHLRRSELGDADVVEAPTLAAAGQLLQESDFDIVLLDLGLPDAEGLEALDSVMTSSHAPPVVVLTGNSDERAAVAAVAAGAQDYLAKGSFDASTLARVVRYAIERGRTVATLRRLETELVAERNRLTQAHRIARLGSWSFDPATDEFTVSHDAAAIVGLGAGTHRLADVIGHVDPADRDEVEQAFERALSARPGAAVVGWIHDGDRRWLHLRAEPVGGPRRLVLGTVQDVTDREEAASERAQMMARVEHAQRLESLGRLAGGIAHNFNNLLAAMSMQSELLTQLLPEALPDDPEVRHELEDLRRTIDRASALTRELLVFGRARDTPIETFPVNDLVQRLRTLIDQVIGEEVEVSVDLDPDAGAIAADRNQIEQAVLNLVINGRDAMEGGGVLVVRTCAPDTDHVEIQVQDHGTGMTAEVRSRAIEPFFSTKSTERGTGLGLSIVHGSVTQAGGAVEIHSEPGRGTTVVMRFPAAVVADAITPTAAPASRPEPDRVGASVLVVDDQPTIVRLVAKLLGQRGYQVATAGSAAEALELLASGAPVDVVVTDLVMPGTSGRDLVLEIRRGRPEAAVVLMSGYSDGQLLDEELAAQRLTFLGKPFTGAQLEAAVRRAMDRSRVVDVSD